jgi:hypothetical protein
VRATFYEERLVCNEVSATLIDDHLPQSEANWAFYEACLARDEDGVAFCEGILLRNDAHEALTEVRLGWSNVGLAFFEACLSENKPRQAFDEARVAPNEARAPLYEACLTANEARAAFYEARVAQKEPRQAFYSVRAPRNTACGARNAVIFSGRKTGQPTRGVGLVSQEGCHRENSAVQKKRAPVSGRPESAVSSRGGCGLVVGLGRLFRLLLFAADEALAHDRYLLL